MDDDRPAQPDHRAGADSNYLAERGLNPRTLREQLRAQIAWIKVRRPRDPAAHRGDPGPDRPRHQAQRRQRPAIASCCSARSCCRSTTAPRRRACSSDARGPRRHAARRRQLRGAWRARSRPRPAPQNGGDLGWVRVERHHARPARPDRGPAGRPGLRPDRQPGGRAHLPGPRPAQRSRRRRPPIATAVRAVASSRSRSSGRPAATCATCAGTPSSTSGSDPRADGGKLSRQLRAQGSRADKRLGQHFLFDPSILRRIAAAAGDLDAVDRARDRPGPGRPDQGAAGGRARPAGRRRARPALRRRICASWKPRRRAASRCWRPTRSSSTPAPSPTAEPVRIVANLPYNVATPLLFGWFERLGLHRADGADVPEGGGAAARRRARARPTMAGSRSWPSSCAGSSALFDLPPAAFTPPPKVSSSVVRLTPRPEQPPPELRATAGRRHPRRLRPAPQDAALQPAQPSAAIRWPCWRRPGSSRRGGRRSWTSGSSIAWPSCISPAATEA